MEIQLSKNFKAALKKRGQKITEFSRENDFNVSTLSEYANGRVPKSFEILVRIANVLKISSDELLIGKNRDEEEEKFINCRDSEKRYEIIVRSL